MRTIVSVAMLSTLLAALAPRAFADSAHLRIDPAASKVTAAVAEPDRTKGTATGKFDITSGEVSGDSANPAAGGSVTIVLDAKSYDSGNPFRDDAVFNLLDAGTYPAITFHSTGLQNVAMSSASAGTTIVAGSLTLHGTTHQVSVPINAALDSAGRLDGRWRGDLQLCRLRGESAEPTRDACWG